MRGFLKLITEWHILLAIIFGFGALYIWLTITLKQPYLKLLYKLRVTDSCPWGKITVLIQKNGAKLGGDFVPRKHLAIFPVSGDIFVCYNFGEGSVLLVSCE